MSGNDQKIPSCSLSNMQKLNILTSPDFVQKKEKDMEIRVLN